MTDTSTEIRWRMPDEGEAVPDAEGVTDFGAALARAFGHFPITLRPEDEGKLRAMAAVWGDMSGNPYYSIANIISNSGTIVLFLRDTRTTP